MLQHACSAPWQLAASCSHTKQQDRHQQWSAAATLAECIKAQAVLQQHCTATLPLRRIHLRRIAAIFSRHCFGSQFIFTPEHLQNSVDMATVLTASN